MMKMMNKGIRKEGKHNKLHSFAQISVLQPPLHKINQRVDTFTVTDSFHYLLN